MRSAWEQLTAGQCNNAEPLKIKGQKVSQRNQAKFDREGYRKATKRVQAKLDRLRALDELGTPEARKVKRSLSDSWTKRSSNNVTGFYDRKAARAAKRGEVC